MRKCTLLGILAGLLVVAAPAGANVADPSYGTDCTYAKGQPVSPGVDDGTNQVYVYALGTGSTGNAGTTTAGACVNVPNGQFEGGTAEVGNGSQGTYAVVDGDEQNTVSSSKGYIGVSTYEDGASKAPCPGDGQGAAGSTNSGGCFGLKPVPTVGVPAPVMCGFTSGSRWNDTQRDGCYIP
jgi:hypothetical protein